MITKTRNYVGWAGPQHCTQTVESVWLRYGPNQAVKPDSRYVPGYQIYLRDPNVGYQTSGGSGSIVYGVGGAHNPCTHTDKQLVLFNSPFTYVYRHQATDAKDSDWYTMTIRVDNPCSIGELFQRGISSYSGFGAMPALTPTWNTTTWELDYSSRALQAMWPGVTKMQFSSLNFLWEMKDFKLLLATCKKLKTAARIVSHPAMRGATSKSQRSLLNTMKYYKNLAKTLNLSKLLANLHLAVQFGVKPLVSDLSKLWNVAEDARAEARRLRAQAGKRLRSHYAEPIPFVNPADKLYDGTLVYTYRLERVGRFTKSVYHATMDYSYELDPLTQATLDRGVLLDKLGILWDPSIVWNAVPWTFAVDWVCRVGDFLAAFRRVNVRPIVKIHRFIHSVKCERQTAVTLQYCRLNTFHINPVVTLARETERIYIRRPYVPNIYASLQTSGLSNREILLAASLARMRYR